MKIGLRAGHSDNCQGAVGIVNEHEQMKKYYNYIKEVLTKYGHTVIDCNSNANTENMELAEGASKANNNNVDLFISLHMNCFNGQAHGAECLVSSTSSRAYAYATRLVNNYASLGFSNRGVKCQKLYEMNHIAASNIISEICFCDSAADIDIYNKYSWEQLAYAFCNAIDSNIPFNLTQYKKGWNQDSKGWFYSPDQESYYNDGWIKIEGKWFYFVENGYITSGWIKDDGFWYYLNEKHDGSFGAMVTGWITYKGRKCYLEENSNGYQGRCYCNETAVIDGIEYVFDKNGYVK
ncbi:N-acetylmuramoyl-L-alanine amidase [Clostridium sp. BJN0001]|uniref:N-acetylmuramoyl-L-alanine amidase n=1 Tax=Clostridium sp. BJN0001 TaxID=2930219 RepID=UPI001FD35A69|nr:N-acetylmuramoyl-L-alanine amidase [Clostridium sp. BJN0001]